MRRDDDNDTQYFYDARSNHRHTTSEDNVLGSAKMSF